MGDIRYLVSSDCSILMEFGNEISKEINAKIRDTVAKIKDDNIDGIVEMVPTYRSITINYDPLKISYSQLVEKLKGYEQAQSDTTGGEVNLIEIPTLYAGEYGPDIANVASNANLSEEEVIKIHAGTDYLVYMLGFLPGFTYLGGLDERIATPRLKSPRLKIAPGSVGIAGTQTGMYPSESPGGWQLIGRTPVRLYDPENDPPVFINSGDYIRYVSITKDEYDKIAQEVERGEYKVKITKVSVGDLNG